MNLFNIPGTSMYVPVPDGWSVATVGPSGTAPGHAVAPGDHVITLSGILPDTDEVRNYSATVTFTARMSASRNRGYFDRTCKVSVRQSMLISRWDYVTSKRLPPAWRLAGYGGVRLTESVFKELLQNGRV